MNVSWLKPAFWGGIVGAVAVTIIGFSADWVVTNGRAQQMAEQQAREAVIAALTPICIAQFNNQPEEEQTTYLAALQDASSWQRGDYVEEQGWATMPGSQEPNTAVADACASELLEGEAA